MPEAPVIKLHRPPSGSAYPAHGRPPGTLHAGNREYDPGTVEAAPFGKISGQLGRMAYGVVLNLDEKSGEFDYFLRR